MCGAHRNPVFGELSLRAPVPLLRLWALFAEVNLRSFAPASAANPRERLSAAQPRFRAARALFAQQKHPFGDGISRIIRFAGIFICARVTLATAAPTAAEPADRSTFSRFQRCSIALSARPCNHGRAEFLHRTRNALRRIGSSEIVFSSSPVRPPALAVRLPAPAVRKTMRTRRGARSAMSSAKTQTQLPVRKRFCHPSDQQTANGRRMLNAPASSSGAAVCGALKSISRPKNFHYRRRVCENPCAPQSALRSGASNADREQR